MLTLSSGPYALCSKEQHLLAAHIYPQIYLNSQKQQINRDRHTNETSPRVYINIRTQIHDLNVLKCQRTLFLHTKIVDRSVVSEISEETDKR